MKGRQWKRLDDAPENFLNRLIWRWMTDPIGFVMTRKMRLGIQRRTETDHA